MGGGKPGQHRLELGEVASAGPVLLLAFQQVLDHFRHGGAAGDLAEVLRVIRRHRRQRFGPSNRTAPDVILHGGDQRDAEFREHFRGGHVGIAVVRAHVGDVLHARLDSLRHELGLLFGGIERGENLPQPFAVAVVGNGEADPLVGGNPVHRHRRRTEFHEGGWLPLAGFLLAH